MLPQILVAHAVRSLDMPGVPLYLLAYVEQLHRPVLPDVAMHFVHGDLRQRSDTLASADPSADTTFQISNDPLIQADEGERSQRSLDQFITVENEQDRVIRWGHPANSLFKLATTQEDVIGAGNVSAPERRRRA
ncbi:MAG: hypothetical protein P8Y29_03185, partial [Gemmatimonadota bacterium]